MLPSQAARGSRADRSLAEGKEDEDADDDSECKERTADAAKPSRKRKQSSKCKHIAAGKDLASRAKIDLPQPAPVLCMVGAPRPRGRLHARHRPLSKSVCRNFFQWP